MRRISTCAHKEAVSRNPAKAQATRLANHTTTLATEYARVGLDWETELRQRAKEKKLMDELGLAQSQCARKPEEGSNAYEWEREVNHAAKQGA